MFTTRRAAKSRAPTRMARVGLGTGLCIMWAAGSLPAAAAVILTTPPQPLEALDSSTPPIELDFADDGSVDFTIPGSAREVHVNAGVGGRILARQSVNTFFAADLQDGSFVGAVPDDELIWRSGSVIMSSCASAGVFACFGNFLGGIEYLGVEIDIDGQAHYGWIEIQSRPNTTVAIVHRWAYESEPGVPIFAGRIPEPSAAALLFASLILSGRRRRR